MLIPLRLLNPIHTRSTSRMLRCPPIQSEIKTNTLSTKTRLIYSGT